MDPKQLLTLTESIRLCSVLLNKMEEDKDRISACMGGALRRAYLETNERAIEAVKKTKSLLQQSIT